MHPAFTESVNVSAHSVPTAVPRAICILINTFIVVFRGRYAITPVADEETESWEWSSLCPLSLSKWKDRQCFSEPGPEPQCYALSQEETSPVFSVLLG